ncbi:MAG: hypothetical protein AAGC85_02420 [Bacteroidota bacterium]
MRIIGFIFVLIPFHGFAQMVVSNPTADIKLAESVIIAEEQAQRLNEQMELLKNAQETLEKVNESLQQVDLIRQIITDQKNIISGINQAYQELQSTEQFSLQELSNILQTFIGLILRCEQQFALITDVLKDGVFQMNDSERLGLLMTLDGELTEIQGDSRLFQNKYSRIAQKRALVKALNGER